MPNTSIYGTLPRSMSLFTNVPLPSIPDNTAEDHIAHTMQTIVGPFTKVQVSLLSKYLGEQKLVENDLIERSDVGGLVLTSLGQATINKFSDK